MTNGLIGKKLGMTQVFDESRLTPVTIIEAGPCRVVVLKTKERDQYFQFFSERIASKAGAPGKPEITAAAFLCGSAVVPALKSLFDDATKPQVEAATPAASLATAEKSGASVASAQEGKSSTPSSPAGNEFTPSKSLPKPT